MYCIKILCIFKRLCSVCSVFENKFWYHCSLMTRLLQEITQLSWPNSLLCRRRINRIAGFCKMGQMPTQWKQQNFSCKASSVTALSDTDFGNHNPQTLYHPTSFYEDFLKKQSTAINPEAWKALNTTPNRLLPSLTNRLLQYKLQKHCGKGECLSPKRWGTFSASVVITHCLSLSQYLWKNKN